MPLKHCNHREAPLPDDDLEIFSGSKPLARKLLDEFNDVADAFLNPPDFIGDTDYRLGEYVLNHFANNLDLDPEQFFAIDQGHFATIFLAGSSLNTNNIVPSSIMYNRLEDPIRSAFEIIASGMAAFGLATFEFF